MISPLAQRTADTQLDDPERGQPNTSDFQTFFWSSMARWQARRLPQEADIILLIAFCAMNRGHRYQGDSPETLKQAIFDSIAECKLLQETKQRQFGMSDEQIDSRLTRNVAHLLLKNPNMSATTAMRTFLVAISAAKVDLESREVLDNSYGIFMEQLFEWLRRMKIPFTNKQPIVIPSTVVGKALQRFKGLPGFFLSPDIPRDKEMNAIGETGLDDTDVVNALIDCTFWGSAKDCIVFGSRAIYFSNDGRNGFLPYSDFPDRTFAPLGETDLSLGRNLHVSVNGSGMPPSKLMMILDELKKEAIGRESGVLKQSGLAALAGLPELKTLLLEEVVAPLREPEKYRKYGISIPNGILMYGPPGCGKTFVAQRLAAELNRNFYEVGPSAVGSPYIHEAGLKIRQLFDAAAASAPALMFVDEFEGMVPARSSLGGEQQFKAEEVNEWLLQIGSCADRGILFVAATNEPWSIDPAVQRSGRLDKKIYVGPPDEGSINQMLLFHLKGRLTASGTDIGRFAHGIAGLGYSAADLKLMVDEAAKLAMRNNVPIGTDHLEIASAKKVAPSISDEVVANYAAFGGGRRS